MATGERARAGASARARVMARVRAPSVRVMASGEG